MRVLLLVMAMLIPGCVTPIVVGVHGTIPGSVTPEDVVVMTHQGYSSADIQAVALEHGLAFPVDSAMAIWLRDQGVFHSTVMALSWVERENGYRAGCRSSW